MRLNTCFTNITGGYSKGCGQEALQEALRGREGCEGQFGGSGRG